MRISKKEDIVLYAYADDMAVGSKGIMKLQRTIDDLEKWCSKHRFVINIEKTEIMAFRQ
jgi:Reverse transcriptase (RNA-dependent DNA polymerase).